MSGGEQWSNKEKEKRVDVRVEFSGKRKSDVTDFGGVRKLSLSFEF